MIFQIPENDQQGVTLDLISNGTTIDFSLKKGINVIVLPFDPDVIVYPFGVNLKFTPVDGLSIINKIQKKVVYTLTNAGVLPSNYMPLNDDMQIVIGYIDGVGLPNTRLIRPNSKISRTIETADRIEEVYDFEFATSIAFDSQSNTYIQDVLSADFTTGGACFPTIKYNIWCS